MECPSSERLREAQSPLSSSRVLEHDHNHQRFNPESKSPIPSAAPTGGSFTMSEVRPAELPSLIPASDVPSSRLLPLRHAIMNSAVYQCMENCDAPGNSGDDVGTEDRHSSRLSPLASPLRATMRGLVAAEFTVRETHSEVLHAGDTPLAPTRRTSGLSVESSRTWSKVHRDIAQQFKLEQRVVKDIVRRKPWVLVVPLLMLLLLCGLGLFGVMFASVRYTDQQKAYAREAMASASASVMAGQLEIATFAVMSLSSYITQQPECGHLNLTYNSLSERILSWDTQRMVYQIQALPAARLLYIYPPVSEELGKILYGRDLLEVPLYRNDTLQQISNEERYMLGPYKLLEGFRAMFVSYPIFLPASDPEYDWGCNVKPHDCPPGLCWKPERREKLWGVILGIISLDNMEDGFRFRNITQQGYLYRLRQLADDINRAAVIGTSQPPPRDPVSVTISKFNLVWVFEVAPSDGWGPSWRNPCIAAVVVGSVVVSSLVLWLLITREKHNMLLRAMLPVKVIRQLQRGEQTVVEEFINPVTILFSDIVSYTEVASQLTPLQVVRLLNELYTQFDALTDKHGVYKVETIGDAFMCVSGCPTTEDPVRAAVRMAGMAQDMIAVVRRFKSQVAGDELQVKIRLGLHSGPVVAGVIGQRMPRYCLFGDTVNTASRMESNSAPMCINISSDTAKLLIAAGAHVVPYYGDTSSPVAQSRRRGSQTLSSQTLLSAGSQPAGSVLQTQAGIPQALTADLQQQQHGEGVLPNPIRDLSFVSVRLGEEAGGGELVLHSRGRVYIKGKGYMNCFWLGTPPSPSTIPEA